MQPYHLQVAIGPEAGRQRARELVICDCKGQAQQLAFGNAPMVIVTTSITTTITEQASVPLRASIALLQVPFS